MVSSPESRQRMRVLIVSPHFPPVNGADMHRVRLLLPHLRSAGIDAEVLAVSTPGTTCPLDPWLESGLPEETIVHRAGALSKRWAKVPGLGTIGIRAYSAIRRAGDGLLAARPFDCVYFSTTAFELFHLGPRWKQRFRVPFFLDYQDPWLTDYYDLHPELTPPGGRLKYAMTRWLGSILEPRTLRHASGLTTVSAPYARMLGKRYPFLEVTEFNESETPHPNASAKSPDSSDRIPLPFLELPFPCDDRDWKRACRDKIPQPCFDPGDGKLHIVYVGVCGPFMAKTLEAFFRALARELTANPSLRERVRVHFIGTSYARAGEGSEIVTPIAAGSGLGDVVSELTDRVPLSVALACLRDASILFIPGSDDPDYNASKLFTYLVTGKPLLAIFEKRSPVSALLRSVPRARLTTFDTSETAADVADRIDGILDLAAVNQMPDPAETALFEANSAATQSKRLRRLFASALPLSETA